MRSSGKRLGRADAPGRTVVVCAALACCALLAVATLWGPGGGGEVADAPDAVESGAEAGTGPVSESFGEASGPEGGGRPSYGAEGECDVEIVSRLTVPEVCAANGVLESTASGGLGVRARWRVGAPLPEAARSVVEQYRDAGSVDLAFDGYVDLFQKVWGCVVQGGEGWVEVVLVDERGGGSEGGERDGGGDGACSVTVVRLGGEDVGGGIG